MSKISISNSYFKKLERDLAKAKSKGKTPSRFLSLKKLAAEGGLAVDRLMCCGHTCASYFFYRLNDPKAAEGGYTVKNSYTLLNPDRPRGTPSEIDRHYEAFARAEGLDEAFELLKNIRTVEQSFEDATNLTIEPYYRMEDGSLMWSMFADGSRAFTFIMNEGDNIEAQPINETECRLYANGMLIGRVPIEAARNYKPNYSGIEIVFTDA